MRESQTIALVVTGLFLLAKVGIIVLLEVDRRRRPPQGPRVPDGDADGLLAGSANDSPPSATAS